MEGIILISLISYIDMNLMTVYMYEGPSENSSNITIIITIITIIIIIIFIIINYIIIMIILWLYIVIFIIEVEPVLQDITGEELNRGANTTLDVWLAVVARGFWERQRSAFFDVRVCHLNTDSYRDLDPDQIFMQHKTEKKSQSMPIKCTAEQELLIHAISFQHDRWYGGGMSTIP